MVMWNTISLFVLLVGQSPTSVSFVETARLMSEHIPGLQILESPEGFQFSGQIARSEDLELLDEISRRSHGAITNRVTVSPALLERKTREISEFLGTKYRVTRNGDSIRVLGPAVSKAQKERLKRYYPRLEYKKPRQERKLRSDEPIFLELAFVEIKRSHLRQLGLRFGTPIEFRTVLSSQSLKEASSWVRFDGFNPLGSFLDAALDQGQAEIHLKQSLIARNHQTANLRVGGEVNVRLVSENSSRLDQIRYGMTLAFTPRLIGKDRIRISVEASIREPSGLVVDGLPGIDERSLSSELDFVSGESVAIAGFSRSRNDKTRSSLPGLGEIPLAGRLFSSQGRQTNHSEAYIFITPRVMKTSWRPKIDGAR